MAERCTVPCSLTAHTQQNASNQGSPFSDCLTLKMQAVYLLQMSVTIYQETQHHIPVALYVRQHHCDHLKCQSDTDVILWPCTHFIQHRHLQLMISTQHLSCQGQWNRRLAVICNYLLTWLYIQILFPRMLPPPPPSILPYIDKARTKFQSTTANVHAWSLFYLTTTGCHFLMDCLLY